MQKEILTGVILLLISVSAGVRNASTADENPGLTVRSGPAVLQNAITPFDEFGDIRVNDMKARLDNFAIQLQTYQGIGYMVAYDELSCRRAGYAMTYAKRARSYLLNNRGIRIQLISGGRRNELTFMLYALPAGSKPPVNAELSPCPVRRRGR